MRKDELIASVQKLITKQGLTQDSLKFVHPKVVETEIAKAYRSLLIEYYANDANLMTADLDYFAKKYTEPVKKDENYFWVNLPASVVNLKQSLGIRYVRPKAGGIHFQRLRETELSVLKNLSMYCCLKSAYYYIDGNRIVLDFPMPEHSLVEEVEIKLLPEFSEFDDSDDIKFPVSDADVTQMILQSMGIRPTDNVNDDTR